MCLIRKTCLVTFLTYYSINNYVKVKIQSPSKYRQVDKYTAQTCDGCIKVSSNNKKLLLYVTYKFHDNNNALKDMKSKEDIANVLLDRTHLFFHTATWNLPTSVTTISTKCVFYKRIMFPCLDSVLLGTSVQREIGIRNCKNWVNLMWMPNKWTEAFLLLECSYCTTEFEYSLLRHTRRQYVRWSEKSVNYTVQKYARDFILKHPILPSTGCQTYSVRFYALSSLCH